MFSEYLFPFNKFNFKNVKPLIYYGNVWNCTVQHILALNKHFIHGCFILRANLINSWIPADTSLLIRGRIGYFSNVFFFCDSENNFFPFKVTITCKILTSIHNVAVWVFLQLSWGYLVFSFTHQQHKRLRCTTMPE